MTEQQSPKRPLRLLLAAPRGFCAGVDRAIKIVELALEQHGAPVYVRHEIVHNRYVVDSLKAKGAVFVEELDEVPAGGHVVFSAHGVPKSVPTNAEARGLAYFDATCPLVSKVHRQAERQVDAGRHIVFVGHAGHPEVVGTFGQVPEGSMSLVETAEDAEGLQPADPDSLAFLTQTTLSVDDTAEIISILRRRFPSITGPKGEDICYATSNRQEAVKAIATQCQLVLVIGAPNSSNSLRLVEVAIRSGTRAHLVQRAEDIELSWFDGIETLGLTAGASAPDILVREIIDALTVHFDLDEQQVTTAEESITFKLPRELAEAGS
ncbi:MAG: 4-hydroxy-3-methylbut-2-enyl diphosphate reductase [Sphingorhabdus sp.]